MSIFPAVIEMLQAENKYRPINQDVLLIGRQTIENSTQTDYELFSDLGAKVVWAMDVSDYEECNIVHDLNGPLPKELHNFTDFIFDGSCLDNIFDPANALRSFSKMLRPGGRMMLMEHGTAIQGALTVFSPEWFFDFFAVNNYVDCQITMMTFPWGMHDTWASIPWAPYGHDGMPVTATPAVGWIDQNFITMVIAEKGQDSTDDKAPIQAQYRLLHGSSDEVYAAADRRFMSSGRRNANS